MYRPSPHIKGAGTRQNMSIETMACSSSVISFIFYVYGCGLEALCSFECFAQCLEFLDGTLTTPTQ